MRTAWGRDTVRARTVPANGRGAATCIRTSHRQVVTHFRELLVAQGLLAAMRFANEQSRHRFTAIYRFDGPTLRNVLLVDRADASVNATPDLPVLESYCVYVREASARFLTDDAPHDARTTGHAKREAVQSYCGIPIMAMDGTLWGTICHFDYAPVPFDEGEVALLESLAPMVMRAIDDGTAGIALDGRDSAA